MANGVVTAEQAAAKAHIDAVNRDYVLQPRLGAHALSRFTPSGYGLNYTQLRRLSNHRRSERPAGHCRFCQGQLLTRINKFVLSIMEACAPWLHTTCLRPILAYKP